MSLALPLAADPGPRRFTARQEEVLGAVEAVILRDGVHGIRMGDLATEVHCSRSTLYEIAPSKDELLVLILDRILRRMSARGAEAIASARTNVDGMTAMLATAALDFAELGPPFVEAIRSHPSARMLFDRWVVVCRDALERLIDDAAAAGEIRPVPGPVVAEMMFVAVLRFTDPDFTRTSRVTPADAMAQMVDVVLNGLRRR